MGLFVEHVYISGFDGSIREAGTDHRMWDGYTVFRQATWRYLASDALQRLSCRAVPLERVIDRVFPPKDEERFPIGVRVDLWLFDFSHAGRTPVAEWTTPRTEPLPPPYTQPSQTDDCDGSDEPEDHQ